jgi:hypothetical protein
MSSYRKSDVPGNNRTSQLEEKDGVHVERAQRLEVALIPGYHEIRMFETSAK